jgi:hypothetical protein
MVDAPEYRSLSLKVTNVVANVEVVHCVSGAEIPRLLEEATAARKQLGITT